MYLKDGVSTDLNIKKNQFAMIIVKSLYEGPMLFRVDFSWPYFPWWGGLIIALGGAGILGCCTCTCSLSIHKLWRRKEDKKKKKKKKKKDDDDMSDLDEWETK